MNEGHAAVNAPGDNYNRKPAVSGHLKILMGLFTNEDYRYSESSTNAGWIPKLSSPEEYVWIEATTDCKPRPNSIGDKVIVVVITILIAHSLTRAHVLTSTAQCRYYQIDMISLHTCKKQVDKRVINNSILCM